MQSYSEAIKMNVDDIDKNSIKYINNYKIYNDKFKKYKELLDSNFENVVVAENNLQSASSVGKIGYKKHKEKDLASADTIMPMYLRKSQAERMKKEKGA